MSDRQIPHDVARLYTDFAELKTAVIGIDGTNGIKGELKKHIELNHANINVLHKEIKDINVKVDRLITEVSGKFTDSDKRLTEVDGNLKQYLKYDRETSCHGIKAVENLKKEMSQMNADRENAQIEREKILAEMAKSRMAMTGTVVVAFIYVVGQVVQRIFWG
jgi:hypothetical protein